MAYIVATEDMPKIKSSKAKRGQHVASSLPSGTSHKQKPTAPINDEDVDPLSPVQIRELDRRIRDSADPIRYMLVSEFSRRFILYYNVSDDVYVMNNPDGGTLFKRLKSAESIKKQLGKRMAIVKYTTKGGKLKRLSPYRRTWGSKTRKDT